MRFHLGFSRKISLKTLIFLLGTLFIGLLAYFGFIESAYADTFTNVNITSASFFSNTQLQYLSYSDSFANPYDVSPPMYKMTNEKRFYFYSSSTKYRYLPFAMSKGFAQTSSNSWYNQYLVQDFSVDITNNSYCSNNTNSLKSINLQFGMYVSTTLKHDYESFNQTNVNDLFDVRILSISGDNVFPTTCSKVRVDNGVSTLSGEYAIICNNVFQGNNENPVTAFRLQVLNAIPFNDRFLDSSSNLGIVIQWEIREQAYDNSTFVFRYSCSDDPPVIDSGPGNGDDDVNGLNDIYDEIKGNYSNDLPGIDTNLFLLDYPQNIQELVSLPIYLLQNILDNGSVCQPYELDLSSLTSLGNNSQTLTITIPCMRTKLSQLLGNLYTLIDVLMASFVFYNVALHIIELLDVLTSGVDLWSYYFSSTNEGRKFRHGIWEE